MPRQVTTALKNLHASGQFEVHVDWLIERVVGGVATLQTYRSFGGHNWIGPWNFTVGVDQNIGSGTLSLIREHGTLSLSTLMKNSSLNRDGATYAPALDGGREIECRFALTAKGGTPDASYNSALTTYDVGNWMPVFQGITDFVGLEENPIRITFRDRSGPLADAQIFDAREYGSDAGTPVETVTQQLLDTEIPGQYLLALDPGAPGFNIRRGKIQPQKVWEALEAFTQQFGWRHQQKWHVAGNEFRLTLIEPDRDVTVPHYSLGPGQYISVRELNIDLAPLRTIVRGRAVDKDTGTLLTYQVPAEEDVATDPQVLKYGSWRKMQLAESRGGAIDTQAELETWVDSAYADVSVPPLPHEVECMLLPWVETGDYIQFLANGVHYDEDQYGAVHTVTHESGGPGRGRTRIRTTGKPKGAYRNWALASVELAGFNAREQQDPGLFNLYDFGEVKSARTATSVTIGWTRGPAVTQVHVYRATLAVPITTEPRTALLASYPTAMGAGEDSYTIPIPARGYKTFLMAVPYGGAQGTTSGLPEYFAQDAVGDLPTVRLTSQTQGTTANVTDVVLQIDDPQNLGGALWVWTNKASTTAADPTSSPPTTVDIASTPATAGPTLAFSDGSFPLDDILVHAGRGKVIYVQFRNSNGVESDRFAIHLRPWGDTTGPSVGQAKLTAGIVQNAESSPTAAIRIDVGTALPSGLTWVFDMVASGTNDVLRVPGLISKANGDLTVTGTISGASVVAAQNFTSFQANFVGEVRAGDGFILNNGVVDTATLHPKVAGNSGFAVSLDQGVTDVLWVDATDAGTIKTFLVGDNVLNVNSGFSGVGETALVLVHYNGVTYTAKRVTVGAADSGGAGFRVLRVAN